MNRHYKVKAKHGKADNVIPIIPFPYCLQGYNKQMLLCIENKIKLAYVLAH